MNSFSRFLVQFGLVRMTPKWLRRKIRKNKVAHIEFALENGLYNVRKLAAEHLGKIRSEASKDKLILAIDDPVRVVSETIMMALEEIGTDEILNDKIKAKRAYWREVKADSEIKGRSSESLYMPERKDRPSRKTYEKAKEMLRKPMNTGKWF